MSSIKVKAVIAEQIAFLKHEIAETAAIVENLHRQGGIVPWETEACQKSTMQLLEERLQDERQLLADFEQLENARLKRRSASKTSMLT